MSLDQVGGRPMARAFTHLYEFCRRFAEGPEAGVSGIRWVFRKKTGAEVGSPGRGISWFFRLPTLRFRGKIMLGFAVTLAISAATMGFAYKGFERVSAGVASYRQSVAEADLARNIDRDLISYRSLARYFVVTGKEEDGKAALAAEASLKESILQSMKGTTEPARVEHEPAAWCQTEHQSVSLLAYYQRSA